MIILADHPFPLLYVVRTRSQKFCFWWLYISLHVYGGLPSILAVFAVALLAGALALYLSLAAAAYHAWAPAGLWFRASLFAGLCLLAELARARWLTGFPWGASGYAHIEGPLAPLAPWIGSFGMGAVAAWLAALVGISAMRPGKLLGFSWRQKGTGSADGPAAQAVRASPDLLIGLGATVLVLGLVGIGRICSRRICRVVCIRRSATAERENRNKK